MFQIGTCGSCSINYGSICRKRKAPTKSPVGRCHRLLGLVSHPLFSNSKLVVQVVVVCGCSHPAYLLGRDCADGDKLPVGVSVGYALLEWI